MTDWRAAITEAQAGIAPHIRQTPVIATEIAGHKLELKLEHMQHTGSFKPRGAFNTLLSRDVPPAGVVAASGGNHGAAVAYAARQLGHPAQIFVPEIAGPAKIALIRDTGAQLETVPGAYADAFAKAQAHEAATGAIQIHAYDAPETVAGQGTLAMEWEAQGLQADTLLIAVGGGGLIAGALAWLGQSRKVVAVEPDQAATLTNALRHGPNHATEVSGIAANALGARTIGRICYDLAKSLEIETVTVPDSAIQSAQSTLWREARQLTEPAGATALAALTSGAYKPAKDERIAILLCGGNIAPDPLA